MTEEEIIQDIHKMITEKWPDENKTEFFFGLYKGNDLIRYHHTFGQWIRNNYKLWENPWEPEIQGGCDCSPNHPDQVSMRIIKEVWQRGQKND